MTDPKQEARDALRAAGLRARVTLSRRELGLITLEDLNVYLGDLSRLVRHSHATLSRDGTMMVGPPISAAGADCLGCLITCALLEAARKAVGWSTNDFEIERAVTRVKLVYLRGRTNNLPWVRGWLEAQVESIAEKRAKKRAKMSEALRISEGKKPRSRKNRRKLDLLLADLRTAIQTMDDRAVLLDVSLEAVDAGRPIPASLEDHDALRRETDPLYRPA